MPFSPVLRRTRVLGSSLAMRCARLDACESGLSGLSLMTVPDVAARLAGGFSQSASGADLRTLVGEALDTLDLDDLAPLADLPGMVKATLRTLRAAWDAGYDLGARPGCGRHRDLARIERFVGEHLPPGGLLPPEIRRRAFARAHHARAVLGDVEFEGVFEVGHGWRPLLAELGRHTTVRWHVPAGDPCIGEWERSASFVESESGEPEFAGTVCANPKHEVWEALRWAREWVSSGRAQPGEIFIAAPSGHEAAPYFESLLEQTDLPFVLSGGYAALSERDGQQAAALAALLHDGLSRDGVVRLVSACRAQSLPTLPFDWAKEYRDDLPYRTLAHWRHAMRRAAEKGWPGGENQQPILEPVLISLLEAQDVAGAERAGEAILPGPALRLWKHALSHRNLRGLAGVLSEIRVQGDGSSEPGLSVVVGSLDEFATSPRRLLRIIGLTGSGFPRRDPQDPLLPDHLLPARSLRPWTRTELDRRAWRRVRAAGVERVHLSRPHHDAQGRPQRPSPLWPAGVVPARARVIAAPICPLSEADRLFARTAEFAGMDLGRASQGCWEDWRSDAFTEHDGLKDPHPAVERSLLRHHSATSLQKLIRDPLGYVWGYALGVRHERVDERPIRLDPREFGSLVHAILDRMVLDGCTEDQAADRVAEAWRAGGICPPLTLWELQIDEALAHVKRAIDRPELPEGVGEWGEVQFGFDTADPDHRAPWPATAQVHLGEAKLRGKIDHLAFDIESRRAWVTDFKTGNWPIKDTCVLGGCAELQRCLYAVAASQLLPEGTSIEASLLYTALGNQVPLAEPLEVATRLENYIATALAHFRLGRITAGPGATDRFNDLLFALPPNAVGLYLARKAAAFDAVNHELIPLWEVE